MHIPDGLIGEQLVNQALIDPKIQLIIYVVISIVLLAFIFNKYAKNHTEKDIPRLALFAVAIVIIQIIEVPLPVPACVHISLITVLALYDLEGSMIVYTFATIVQAFLGEGGISTVGMNVFNLGIVAPFVAYQIYHLLKSFDQKLALFISAFATITILGILVSIEYTIAGTFPLTFGLTVITPIEAVIGILEGFVTLFVMYGLQKVKPELVPELTE